MTDGATPLPGDVAPAAAGLPTEKEATVAAQPTELDDQALVLRRQSKGFGKIAQALGLARASDANEAFNRALRRRPPDEQVSIRTEENGRLDRLRDAVRADNQRTKEEVDKRLRAIERLRTRLMSD